MHLVLVAFILVVRKIAGWVEIEDIVRKTMSA